jgi:voltage-gated potassium channel
VHGKPHILGPQPEDPAPARRVRLALSVLASLTLLGTIGFMLTEGLDFAEALYMTVITLSTVGYQDVAPVTTSGRFYTIAFILVGVGSALYAVACVAEYLIEGRLREALGRRNMDRTIQALQGHVIVCGFGRMGKAVVEELEQAGASVLVVECDPEKQSELDAEGRLNLLGSALEESVLREAGIARARAIVVAMPNDPDNVFVTLSARELNPEIRVHARAETPQGMRRLRLAGADQVISIHHLGGMRIANAIVRPAVVDFIELAAPGAGAPIDLEEVALSEGCRLDGSTLREIKEHGIVVSVVAIKREGQPMTLDPGPDDVMIAGDHVVVVGDRDNVQALTALAQTA